MMLFPVSLSQRWPWAERAANLAAGQGQFGISLSQGDASAVEKALASAAHVVSADLVNSRVVVAPIETRAAIGAYDPSSDVLHLTLTGQAVHGIRKQLADSVFRVPSTACVSPCPMSAAASA